jgi:type I restriction enzyme S subunit
MTHSNLKNPKLRFPEFEENWRKMRINQLTDRVSIPVVVEANESYTQIGVRSHGKGLFHKEPVAGKELGNKRVFWVKEDLFVVNIVFAWEQAVAKTTKDELGMIASHRFPMFKPKADLLDLDFLLFSFLTRRGKALLELASPGGAGRNKTLGQEEFNRTKINLPCVEEQNKIAAFLLAVDEKIWHLTRKKVLLLKYKKGVMQQIFSQKIRFKKDDGNGFPEWEETKLGHIGSFRSGVGFGEAVQGGSLGIPFYKVSDMNLAGNEIYMTKANNYVTPEQIKVHKYNPIHEPSILFAKVGAAIFLERKRIAQDFLIDNNMMAFTPKGNVLFMKYLFDMIRLSRFAQVGAFPSYNSTDIGIIKVWLPTSAEQTKVVDFLSAIDENVYSVQKQLEVAKVFKKGLLQQMFL